MPFISCRKGLWSPSIKKPFCGKNAKLNILSRDPSNTTLLAGEIACCNKPKAFIVTKTKSFYMQHHHELAAPKVMLQYNVVGASNCLDHNKVTNI